MKITPQGNRVLVEIVPMLPKQSIVLPDNVDLRDYAKIIVREVGRGILTSEGKHVTIPLLAGDEVILAEHSGHITMLQPSWQYNEQKFMIVDYTAIVGKVERTDKEIDAMQRRMTTPSIARAKELVH